ncbi:ribonuclease D [Nocardioides bruguierae]|uniref:ribonuclease D n=1 Tax=Nocardioides bruguierae TaxID=2945102 RepID=UPI002021338B|nr:HRDC domain-containing protein [Nocardioides bruguierae]MCL8025096.1 HRDC domain-containing protein [Nocardioides bruguierae]
MTTAGNDPETTDETAPEAPAHVPLLELRDPMPPVVDTPAALAAVCEAVAAGTGPVAIDAERASGYRYSNRAYLIQLRRTGSGTHLVDPVAFPDLAPLQEAIGDAEWILHAATQDLPCLREEGLVPAALFDTELAGRLLGHARVGLASIVEEVLGRRLKKEHSAVDWSTRPLPEPWLLYAALDVEVLVELREALATELEDQGKAQWAAEEFEHLLDFEPAVREDPWRRTSGVHKLRGRRSLAAVKLLWETRDSIAERRDVTPSRVLPDSAITVAASQLPQDKNALLSLKGFHGRGAERYAARWVDALQRSAALDEEELPSRNLRGDGPPVVRAWADRDPVAARRLLQAREHIAALGEEHQVPVENLLTPDYLRRVLWTPPRTREPQDLAAQVDARLADLGARPWQRTLTGPVIVRAIIDADVEPEPAEPEPVEPAEAEQD